MPHPTHPRRPAWFRCAPPWRAETPRAGSRAVAGRAGLVAIVVVLAAACGGGGADRVVTAGSGAEPPAASPDGLPVLPPVEERQPELFDDAGCLVTGPGEADCETTAGDLDAGAAGATESDERALAGFVGSRWLDGASAPAPVVLTDTITAGADGAGRWSATGLARNDTATGIAGIEVRAVLRGADGAELAVVAATSPVRDVRSGEPVPFDLRSDVDAGAVAEVAWEAVAQDGTVDAAGREVELAVYWVRPEGAPDPLDLYLYRDDGDARPQALFASVTVVGQAAIAQPRLVVAWIDGGGRVLAVDGAPVVTPTGAPATDLAPGSAGDALVLHDGVGGPALAEATPMVWGVAQ